MKTITIIDREKLTAMSTRATGDRATTIAAILAVMEDADVSDNVAFADVLAAAKPTIDARNRKQETDYIVRYYVSELKNTFGAVDHDGKSGGRSSLAEFKVK